MGCGAGDYLVFCRETGWRVVGIETDPEAATAARERALDVRAGTLDTVDLPDGSCDVVTLWHVLEHMDDPSRALKQVRRLLRAGRAASRVGPGLRRPGGSGVRMDAVGAEGLGRCDPRSRTDGLRQSA